MRKTLSFIKTKENKLLLLIALLTLILRLWGINHGFPFIYHPDEPTVVREALTLRSHRFNPGHFDWPHLQIYLSFLIFGVFHLIRSLFNFETLIYPEPVIFYFLARLLTVFMGTVSVVVLYYSGSRLFSKRVGLLSAIFLSLNTLHVSESQVATVDVPMTFWLTASMFFSIKIFQEGKLKDYIFAGLLAGFATSTKYNGGLIIVPIIAAHLIRNFNIVKPETIKEFKTSFLSLASLRKEAVKLIISVISSIVGFLVGTPFALVDYKSFLSTEGPQGALWQFYHVGDQGTTGGVLERYFSLVKNNLFASYGLMITLLSFVGFYYLSHKKSKTAGFLLSFPLIYFVYVGTFSYAPAHFFIPLFPFLSIIAAVGFYAIYKRLKAFFLLDGNKARLSGLILLVSVILSPLWSVVKADYILTQKDTRTQALEWLIENFESGTVFALGGDYEPDLDNTDFATINLHDTLNGKDLSGAIYPYFHEKGARYVILGGFDLPEQLKKIDWDPNKPTYTHYVLARGGLVKRFDPVMCPGPVVLIYEIDYQWEVTDGKGLEEEQ